MGYSYQIAARDLLCVMSHRQDSTYYSLCYISCRALDGKRNSSMGPLGGFDLMTHCIMIGRSTTELRLASNTRKEANVIYNLSKRAS